MVEGLELEWRREWDSNPRLSFPNTRFPSVLLKPLGHLSACCRIWKTNKLAGSRQTRVMELRRKKASREMHKKSVVSGRNKSPKSLLHFLPLLRGSAIGSTPAFGAGYPGSSPGPGAIFLRTSAPRATHHQIAQAASNLSCRSYAAWPGGLRFGATLFKRCGWLDLADSDARRSRLSNSRSDSLPFVADEFVFMPTAPFWFPPPRFRTKTALLSWNLDPPYGSVKRYLAVIRKVRAEISRRRTSHASLAPSSSG